MVRKSEREERRRGEREQESKREREREREKTKGEKKLMGHGERAGVKFAVANCTFE